MADLRLGFSRIIFTHQTLTNGQQFYHRPLYRNLIAEYLTPSFEPSAQTLARPGLDTTKYATPIATIPQSIDAPPERKQRDRQTSIGATTRNRFALDGGGYPRAADHLSAFSCPTHPSRLPFRLHQLLHRNRVSSDGACLIISRNPLSLLRTCQSLQRVMSLPTEMPNIPTKSPALRLRVHRGAHLRVHSNLPLE